MASSPINGNIICQNGLPDLLRAIESIYPICDKIYVCDGGSTDGTWEWLQNVKDIYNLELYQHKFESMAKQRNWLLKKTPLNSWVISLDQDEEICYPKYLRILLDELNNKFFVNNIGVSVRLIFINMINDPSHQTEFVYANAAKIFTNKKGVKFGINDYHAIPMVEKDIPWMTGDADPPICLKHYAFLDPKRSKSRCTRLKNNKEAGASEYEFWCNMEHKVIELPEYLK